MKKTDLEIYENSLNEGDNITVTGDLLRAIKEANENIRKFDLEAFHYYLMWQGALEEMEKLEKQIEELKGEKK